MYFLKHDHTQQENINYENSSKPSLLLRQELNLIWAGLDLPDCCFFLRTSDVMENTGLIFTFYPDGKLQRIIFLILDDGLHDGTTMCSTCGQGGGARKLAGLL